jgi:MerR family mercuric resistance operon transcriptional regulator
VRRIASRHLEAVRGRLADLRKLERLLTQTVSKCSGRKAPECPIIDTLNAQPQC